MKINFKFLAVLFILTIGVAQAQTGIGTMNPDVSAVLDVSSTDKGFLLPRLTTALRDQVATPATGLIIYNTTTNQLQVNTGTTTVPVWTVASGGSTTTASNGLTATSGNVALGGTLSAATTIAQGTNNLTFTGTGNTTFTSPVTMNGGQYLKVTTVTTPTYTILEDDVFISYTGSTNCTLTLPNAATNVGRIIRLVNRATDPELQVNFSGGMCLGFGIAHTDTGLGNTLISDGTCWLTLAQ